MRITRRKTDTAKSNVSLSNIMSPILCEGNILVQNLFFVNFVSE